jgi:anti-anti-sigma regulatory factor
MRLLKLVPQGGRLVLCSCRPALLQLIEKARLEHVLQAYPTEAAAVASLCGTPGPA